MLLTTGTQLIPLQLWKTLRKDKRFSFLFYSWCGSLLSFPFLPPQYRIIWYTCFPNIALLEFSLGNMRETLAWVNLWIAFDPENHRALPVPMPGLWQSSWGAGSCAHAAAFFTTLLPKAMLWVQVPVRAMQGLGRGARRNGSSVEAVSICSDPAQLPLVGSCPRTTAGEWAARRSNSSTNIVPNCVAPVQA